MEASMKFIAMGLALLFSFSAMANTPVAPKIRDAKIRAVIVKQYIEKLENGGVKVRSEKVCSTEFTTGVYDTRSGNVSISFGRGADCESTLRGKPVTVNVNGFMSLSKYSFADEAPVEVKGANLFLVTKGQDDDHKGEIQLPSESAYSATPDLNARSLILHAAHTMWAGEGDFAQNEQFGVTAEFVDDQ
jgi:hypothetical protein